MDDEKKNLVVEIFRATGIKVDEDDPIVLAALYQASLVRSAGDATAAKLGEQTTKIEGASKQLVGHLQDLLRTSGTLASQTMREAREAEETELKRTATAAINSAIGDAVKAALGRLNDALGTLEVAAARSEQKVSDAARAAQPGWSTLVVGVAILSGIFGGAGGFLVHHLFF